MNSGLDEFYFDCPKCKRPMVGDKALLGELINCPDCNEPFIPTPRKKVLQEMQAPPIPQTTFRDGESFTGEPDTAKRDLKIRIRIYGLLLAGIIAFIACGLAWRYDREKEIYGQLNQALEHDQTRLSTQKARYATDQLEAALHGTDQRSSDLEDEKQEVEKCQSDVENDQRRIDEFRRDYGF